MNYLSSENNFQCFDLKRNKCFFLPFQLATPQQIDMVKSILDGANIQNCGDSNEISVSCYFDDVSAFGWLRFLTRFMFELFSNWVPKNNNSIV